jgi:hypothetical protein
VQAIKGELQNFQEFIKTRIENNKKSVQEIGDNYHYLEQWRIDNAIFLSGFREKMDSGIVCQKLASLYNFSTSDVEYHYSFSIPSPKGNQRFHYVVIGFAKRQTKTSLFTKKNPLVHCSCNNLSPTLQKMETLRFTSLIV